MFENETVGPCFFQKLKCVCVCGEHLRILSYLGWKNIFFLRLVKNTFVKEIYKEIFFTIPLEAVHEQVSRPNYVSNRTSQKFKPFTHFTLHKKWSFPFRISSVNVIKSAVSNGDIRISLTVIAGLQWSYWLSYNVKLHHMMATDVKHENNAKSNHASISWSTGLPGSVRRFSIILNLKSLFSVVKISINADSKGCSCIAFNLLLSCKLFYGWDNEIIFDYETT